MDYFKTINLDNKDFLLKVILVNPEDEEELEAAENKMKALASAERIKIFSLLLSKYPKALSSKEISKLTRINSNTIRFHLKILRDSNLISFEKYNVKQNIEEWKYKSKFCGLLFGISPQKWEQYPAVSGEERPFIPKQFIYKKEDG